ncbi:aminotransferase class I/II-fold pyridoxal phosphate-dependent enzyme [Streptomyces sp. NPDC051132]|uniref:aminotransferase class I/II-fold pyridoxal phosphate-dependent enzyme n=1 Tax=unclassified Streptomyces TaxID=2593676 RepID=UPI0034445598
MTPPMKITELQGGDLRTLSGSIHLDLSTCVNRYGPPPAVEAVLRSVDPREILAHPYGMEERFVDAYATFLGVAPEQLVPGRGITEFIRVLAQLLPTSEVAVITPDYTDTIRWFPVHEGPLPGVTETAQSRLDRVASAMARYPYVFFSNPNNPLGLYLHRDHLTDLCRAHPDSVLIVDEAYIDFMAEHRELSMVHSGLDNVVVLRSPNKLLGVAGTRTGALWTRNTELRRRVAERKINWTLSYLDAAVVTASLSDTDWIDRTRLALLDSADRLEGLLSARFPGTITGVPVHYRFVESDEPGEIHRLFAESGIAVRAFDGTEPGRVSGVRITAPTHEELTALPAVLREAAADSDAKAAVPAG